MLDSDMEQCARRLGPRREDVKRMLVTASRSANGARLAKTILRAKLRQTGVNPDDSDPFRTVVAPEVLGGSGIVFGPLADDQGELIWRHNEIPYSAIITGDPGGGKTSLVLQLLIRSAPFYATVVHDLRGDYEPILRVIPNARFLELGNFPVNLLRGPRNVPPAAFNQRFSQIFTDVFDQRQASRRYLNLVLDSLDARRAATGHWPCLLDLRDALEIRKEMRGSDEMRFRNRCVARVDALCRALGEQSVGVEQGVDLAGLIGAGATVVIRSEVEQTVQDFITAWIIMYAFEQRTWAEDKFNQKPLVIVLDEQRSLLRARASGEVTSLELLLTRGRALQISFIVVEQLPRAITPAARVSAHLAAVFCTGGTELRSAAEIVGLRDRREVEQIRSLGKGECIVSLTGDRCPMPLRLRIPELKINRKNLTRAERKFYVANSLTDQLPHVRPRHASLVERPETAKKRERDPNRLSRNAWRVFVHIADFGYETIEERMAALNLNRGEEESARRECATKGYLREAGTIGRGIKFFELTPKSRDFAEKHSVPVRKFKSGLVHEALLYRVRLGISKGCPSVRWTSAPSTLWIW